MIEKTENGDSPRQDVEDDEKVATDAMRDKKGDRSDRKMHDILTAALRNNYQSTVDEGVPDIFQDLIRKLK